MKLTKFSPKKEHLQREKYGLLAETLDEPVKAKKFGGLKLAKIDKKYLGIGGYQRPLKEERVALLRSKWHPEFGGVNVCEIEYKGKFYYQVADGQHRACASPEEYMDCIVTNSQYPVDNFLMANDKNLVNPVSVDEVYWAHIDKYNTVCQKDEIEAKFVFDAFQDRGLTPSPEYKKDTILDFGTSVSKIHRFYHNEIIKQINKVRERLAKINAKKITNKKDKAFLKRFNHLNNLDEKQTRLFTQQVFKDVMDIMFGIFDKTTFNNKRRYFHSWNGMMRYLMKFWDWNYSKEDIVDTLREGRWCRGGKGAEKNNPLGDIKDWHEAQKSYERSVNNLSNQWMYLFADTYKVSKRP